MKTLSDIIKLMDSHDEFYLLERNIASVEDVDNAERKLGVSFGIQFREVLLSKIICVGGDDISICKKVENCPTIVDETNKEWERYPFTKGFVFLLSQGEWHIFVDSDDYVYLVEVGGNKIEPQNKKLFDWIFDTAERHYSILDEIEDEED